MIYFTDDVEEWFFLWSCVGLGGEMKKIVCVCKVPPGLIHLVVLLIESKSNPFHKLFPEIDYSICQ